MSFVTSQPGKGIYTLYTILYVLTTLPITLTKCAFFRSHPRWTFKQNLSNTLVKAFLDCCATIHMKTPQPLTPGAEKDSFTLIKPAAPEFYQGPCQNPSIKPATIGGIWLPTPPPATSTKSEKFLLHLHGGAYVLLSPREAMVQWGPKTLLSAGIASHALLPDYRLSSNASAHFPAALQDAVSAYTYLLHDLSIPPSNIILSGDSAGGNLVLALLRYIADSSTAALPAPAAALLWSPWCDMGRTPDSLVKHRNYGSDYITPALLEWGVSTYVPADARPSDPYFSPALHPFAVKGATKLFVQVGSAEVLADEIARMVDGMRKVNGEARVVLHESADAMHDTFASGENMGFLKEAQEAARAATEFVA